MLRNYNMICKCTTTDYFKVIKKYFCACFKLSICVHYQPLGPEDDCIFNWVNFGAPPALWIHLNILLRPVKKYYTVEYLNDSNFVIMHTCVYTHICIMHVCELVDWKLVQTSLDLFLDVYVSIFIFFGTMGLLTRAEDRQSKNRQLLFVYMFLCEYI